MLLQYLLENWSKTCINTLYSKKFGKTYNLQLVYTYSVYAIIPLLRQFSIDASFWSCL